MKIRKAAVIGAGSMGAGIAAQFANAGIPVVLLDRPGAVGASRSAQSEAGVARQLKVGGFMHADAAKRVTPGNIEDDLRLLADADWIVEAIFEDLDAKQEVYRRIEAARKDGSLVSSNTSTIPLRRLVEGLPDRFAGDFVITHFFNPPRLMRLVELVGGPTTRGEALAMARDNADVVLGKRVVAARDTPGFIANRIGCFWMAVAMREAVDLGLTVEEADAVMGAPFGIPRTAIFGLFDLVGIDLQPPIFKSLTEALPAIDDLHAYNLGSDPLIRALIDRGLHGRKAGGGFYRMRPDKTREVLDLATLDYRPERPADLPALQAAGRDLKALASRDDPAGHYAWLVLSRLVAYAADCGPEIADDIAAIDAAMELGYNWAAGPFALADRVGAAWIAERLVAEGRSVPPLLAAAAAGGGFHAADGRVRSTTGGWSPPAPPPGGLRLADVQRDRTPVLATAGAAVWDIGEGIACLEARTKMNTFDDTVFDAIERSAADLPRHFRGLVIGSEGTRAFSAGANLAFVLDSLKSGKRQAADAFIARGQQAFLALRYAAFPVVGAPYGLALGGGCEILLHCDVIVAYAELNVGLPETKIGIVPAWGGCAQMLARFAARRGNGADPLDAARDAFAMILPGRISTSAPDARDIGILRDHDRIVMNRDRLLAEARRCAIEFADAGYRPPEPLAFRLAGPSGKAALMEEARRAGGMTETDEAIAEALASVLTGGEDGVTAPLSEREVMRMEREALSALTRLPATLARIEHMLATGKPLRN